MGEDHRILILGAGYVGMYTALRLQRALKRDIRDGSVSITVISPESYMTYQPFLPETAAGNLEPRHVVVNLRRLLSRCTLVNGRITTIDSRQQRVGFTSASGETRATDYDTLVVALGSVSKLLPIPGLAERGIGIKSVGEAVLLRNHVLRRLDVAASTDDEGVRQRALTFTVVGGGFAGIETLAELENMSRWATRYYDTIDPQDLRWILVEATDRILPELDRDMGERTREMLEARGITIHMETQMKSAENGRIVLSSGEIFESDTLIWTAGVRANPALAGSDLPLDEAGRVVTESTLRATGLSNVWAAGDCAAVPDLTQPGSFTPPSAQHAMRQASRLARNILAVRKGTEPTPYRHKNAGAVAGLGLHQGVAQIYGIRLRGWPAWFLHRTYHLLKMPTLNRKFRIVADWTLALFFRRDAVSLGEIHAPREEFGSESS